MREAVTDAIPLVGVAVHIGDSVVLAERTGGAEAGDREGNIRICAETLASVGPRVVITPGQIQSEPALQRLARRENCAHCRPAHRPEDAPVDDRSRKPADLRHFQHLGRVLGVAQLRQIVRRVNPEELLAADRPRRPDRRLPKRGPEAAMEPLPRAAVLSGIERVEALKPEQADVVGRAVNKPRGHRPHTPACTCAIAVRFARPVTVSQAAPGKRCVSASTSLMPVRNQSMSALVTTMEGRNLITSM
jgi:hypothetical protein